MRDMNADRLLKANCRTDDFFARKYTDALAHVRTRARLWSSDFSTRHTIAWRFSVFL